jgi:hypothetical protein
LKNKYYYKKEGENLVFIRCKKYNQEGYITKITNKKENEYIYEIFSSHSVLKYKEYYRNEEDEFVFIKREKYNLDGTLIGIFM